MLTKIIRPLICILMIQLINQNSSAQTLGDDELVAQINQNIADGKYKSVIAAKITADQTIVQSFGALSSDTNEQPNENTFIEISSNSKSFLGTLAALMIDNGELALDNPINNYLPDGVTLASFEGRDVTILDLLTHASGLPMMPPDYQVTDEINPYRNYSQNDLWASINAFIPTHKSGEKWQYSTFGTSILAEALAHSKGLTYFELLSEYILIPLGMSDTHVTLNIDQRRRLAQGHNADGTKTDDLLSQGALSAGSFMISTTNDLIKYVKAQMGLSSVLSHNALKLGRKIYRTDYMAGLMWEKDAGSKNVFNFGTAIGYRAFIGFNEDGSAGAVVLTNIRYGTIDIGKRILDSEYLLND